MACSVIKNGDDHSVFTSSKAMNEETVDRQTGLAAMPMTARNITPCMRMEKKEAIPNGTEIDEACWLVG